ncbi:MAG TPA: hypothetical protein VFI13_00785 [Gemmatimonadales bacterium]|nr:hypothetical protein [Gemmatimonadales bacterium]
MRNVVPVPSLALGACLLTLVAGCGLRDGRVSARWQTAHGAMTLTAPATGAWCVGSRTILVQAGQAGQVVGFVWRYEALHPDSAVLAPPAAADSTPVRATAALRYMADGQLLGFRSVDGLLRVTAVDTGRITATLEARLYQVGRGDSTTLSATFRRVPLTHDTTLCGT